MQKFRLFKIRLLWETCIEWIYIADIWDYLRLKSLTSVLLETNNAFAGKGCWWAFELSNGAMGLCPGELAVARQMITATQKLKKAISTRKAKSGAIKRPGRFIMHWPASSKSADKPANLFFKKYMTTIMIICKVDTLSNCIWSIEWANKPWLWWPERPGLRLPVGCAQTPPA